MKYFKYLIIICLLLIIFISSNQNVNNLKTSIDSNISYNNKEVNNNTVTLDNVSLDSDNNISKQIINYTNNTKNDLLLTNDNINITCSCSALDFNIYFIKNKKNYDKVVLQPNESVQIVVVISASDTTTDATCNYNIALNIGENI